MAKYPGFIEPALATSIDKVHSGDRWVHDIKFDGYRVQVHLRDAAVKVFTRRGNDWTNRFRKITADSHSLIEIAATGFAGCRRSPRDYLVTRVVWAGNDPS